MLNTSGNNWKLAASIVLFCALTVAGCSERELAPEIEYSNSDVEVIRKEIESFEWD